MTRLIVSSAFSVVITPGFCSISLFRSTSRRTTPDEPRRRVRASSRDRWVQPISEA